MADVRTARALSVLPLWLVRACAVLLWVAPARAAEPLPACEGLVRSEGPAMGSALRMAVCPLEPGPQGQAAANAAMAEVASEFKRLEGLWSTWIATSDLSRLNAAKGKPVHVAPETMALLQRALQGSRDTGGLFDVTFAPLGEAWKFDTPPGSHTPTRLERVPTQAEIAALQRRVGWQGLVLNPAEGTAQLTVAGMAVHVGGIGKGAAVDRGVALLKARGFKSFAVQAGGDLYLAGKNGQRPWRVGIAHPRQRGDILGMVEVVDAAFSTSGDYERFAILDGKRYHHILDPRSGWPAMASQSATIRAHSAIDAEVLTKAIFIVGGEAGVQLAERLGAEAVLVDASGKILKSKGIALTGEAGGPP